MPLISHTNLPSFDYLKKEGELILSPDRANNQAIRELHIGLLNMMPDSALEVTERQFFRLIGRSNHIAQFFIHPFTLKSIKRSKKTNIHINKYYQDFNSIKAHGLDAMIITGAHPNLLTNQTPLSELNNIVNWAYNNITSSLFSCFATHAVMQCRYQQFRSSLKKKCWGVFSHKVCNRNHPLVTSLNTRFDVPHSRFNQITKEQFISAGLEVLVDSSIGVHLAVSSDLLRQVFFQGHPEYDTVSLLKEYKREVSKFILGNRVDYPIMPIHYISEQGQAILTEYQHSLQQGSTKIQNFPEILLQDNLDNTWRDSAVSMMNNWIGCVYQTTNKDLLQQFMQGINKNNPLGLI